jgi:steroid 5-alpha reductase family enzyme
MKLDLWLGAAIAWAVIATLWLVLMPKNTKGKSWHYKLAYVPLIPFAVMFLLPPSALTEAIRLWIASGVGVLAVVALGWLAGTALKNHGMMDVAYAFTPVGAALTAWWIAGKPTDLYVGVFFACLLIWALRLGIHVFRDNIKHERQPYAHWRKSFGKTWIWWSAFQVHLMQAVIIWLWSAPIAFIMAAPAPRPTYLLIPAVLVWVIGFGLQMAADSQLAAFKKNPANRGGLLDTGVWSVVRHPNYLGEMLMWMSWWVFALAHPFGWVMIWAPLFNGFFMGFVSAAPFKEAHMARTRPQLWADYCTRVPRLLPFPRPSKKGA